MMKRYLPYLLSLVVAACTHASPLPKDGDVLATNSVLAEYLGTEHLPCRFMTAQCPDHCDHATDVARFRVIKNNSYVRNSEYGDEKASAGSILVVEAKKDVIGQDNAAVHATLSSLKPGDKVDLTVSHRYVNDNGVYTPVRPVTRLVPTAPTVKK